MFFAACTSAAVVTDAAAMVAAKTACEGAGWYFSSSTSSSLNSMSPSSSRGLRSYDSFKDEKMVNKASSFNFGHYKYY